MSNPIDLAIAASGATAIAKACGVSPQFIHKMRRSWQSTGSPPRAMREHAPLIEEACGGTVTAEQLCPDVAWERDESGRVVGYTVRVVQQGR